MCLEFYFDDIFTFLMMSKAFTLQSRGHAHPWKA